MVTLLCKEKGQQEKLQVYDIQPDGSGRLDWAAVKEAFDADTVKIQGRGPPGLFRSGDKEGLTRDIFQPGSVLPVTVSRKQGEILGERQSGMKQPLLHLACNAASLR